MAAWSIVMRGQGWDCCYRCCRFCCFCCDYFCLRVIVNGLMMMACGIIGEAAQFHIVVVVVVGEEITMIGVGWNVMGMIRVVYGLM